MIASPSLPDFSSETSCRIQNGISGIGAGAPILPRFGILASRDDRLCTTPGDGLVTALRVIGTVAADADAGAGDGFAVCNLVEQAWQHRCVADCVIGHFDSPDFQRRRIDAKMGLAPLATVARAVLLRLPLAFAEHLDAGAVDQQVQAGCRGACLDRHRQMFLVPADGAEVRNLPIQAGQLEQALRHPHRLAQRQIGQALDGQTELDCGLTVLRTAAPLAAGAAVPAHILLQPGEQRASRLQRCVVFFPVGRSVLRFGCFMTALGVVGAVAADARDHLIDGNLVKQAW